MKQYSLIADIGGTNARFALVQDGGRIPVEPRNLAVRDYPSLVDAIRAYVEQVGLGEPWQAAISLASPVVGDQVNMTNHCWQFSVRDVRSQLGMRHLKVLNDYTALALALPHLGAEECRKIGKGEAVTGFPMAVLGPGTGLGVSGAIPAGKHWIPLEGEGGHVSYGPLTGREQRVIDALRTDFPHVSAELLVSGGGLALTYQVMSGLGGRAVERPSPGEVTRLALEANDAVAIEALGIFCGVLGTVAGNLALTLGARGGVYIGGGIVLKLLDFFAASDFRERFEQHGRLTAYLRNIPTHVIDTPYPALTGAVVALDPAYENVGVVSHEIH